MRAVNLLPEQERQRGTTLLTTPVAVIGGAALVLTATLFVGIAFYQSHGKVSDREATLSSIREQTTQVQAATVRSASERGQEQARVAAFTSAAGARFVWDDLLDDISRVLPNGSWLTSLTMQGAAVTAPTTTPGAPAATAPVATGFNVAGVALNQDVVAQVMQRLELIPELSGVTLQQSTRTAIGDTPAYQFTMTASILAPEVPR
jgi:Tfp pilus assembly protein PilN